MHNFSRIFYQKFDDSAKNTFHQLKTFYIKNVDFHFYEIKIINFTL